jgi:hypothetical protein
LQPRWIGAAANWLKEGQSKFVICYAPGDGKRILRNQSRNKAERTRPPAAAMSGVCFENEPWAQSQPDGLFGSAMLNGFDGRSPCEGRSPLVL